jgi:hypothetical protein
MRPYRDIDRDSGVAAYEYDPDWIHVQFSTGSTYEYTYSSAGHGHIETMKHLADSGEGLNAFINTTVKKSYSRKVR